MTITRQSVLKVSNLKLYYRTSRGKVKAVDDVSFELQEGETLGIVGESGSGKTSIALALSRLLPPNVDTYQGSITLGDREITTLSDEVFRKEIRWKKISIVFQGAMNSLNPVVKIGKQMAEPLLLSKVGKADAYRMVKEQLSLVGLSGDDFDRYSHELSGGMKQRVVIAMALILKPQIIILDEPTSSLDVRVQAQITNLLKQLKQELGISMIFITHDIALSSDICDRHAVLYGGEIIEQGSAEQILENPKHPYTQLLLASTPRLGSEKIPKFIPGAPPDLVNLPSGCRFHPRCPFAEKCDQNQHLELEEIGNGRSIRCRLFTNRII